MTNHSNSEVIVHHKYFHVMNIGMIALLLVGAFLAARPVQAAPDAICTTTADGVWTSAAIWDCGRVPLSTDDAVIAHEVSFATSRAIHSLSVELGGALRFDAPVTLTINGNFTKAESGVFDPGNDYSDPVTGGTVVFGAGSNTITTNGEVVDFFNLTKIASGLGETLSVDPQGVGGGYIHILNSLVLKGTNGSTLLALRSTVPASKWGIEAEGTTDVNFVDVQDSNNLGDMITVTTGHDSGNNTNWSFPSSLNLSSVSLSASPNPSVIGVPVTFTATISPVGASSGDVEFYLDGDEIASCSSQPVSLVGGVPTATCTVSNLALGSHNIKAEYGGNSAYLSSTSSTIAQEVVKITSIVGVVSSLNQSIVGQPVTLTATINPLTSGGTVIFKSNGAALTGCENKALVSGSAQCVIDLPAGSYAITVEYSGDSITTTGTSPTLTQVVSLMKFYMPTFSR